MLPETGAARLTMLDSQPLSAIDRIDARTSSRSPLSHALQNPPSTPRSSPQPVYESA
eukprot:COSAG01_NODE_7964_length_2974_cov_2.305739_3_plen_57_part_00